MPTKSKSELLIALVTAAAMIAFALYQRHNPITASPETFFYAAAIICILPAFYALVRCKLLQGRKTLRVG